MGLRGYAILRIASVLLFMECSPQILACVISLPGVVTGSYGVVSAPWHFL